MSVILCLLAGAGLVALCALVAAVVLIMTWPMLH